MFSLVRSSFNQILPINLRLLSVSSTLNVKEIKIVQDDKSNTVISGINVPSGREPYMLKNPSSACPVCASGLDIKHTDVLILNQFVRSDGCMLPRRITGLCKQQQKRVSTLVTMAHKSGLMPNLHPPNSKDPKLRPKWKKYNKYFEESTIKV